MGRIEGLREVQLSGKPQLEGLSRERLLEMLNAGEEILDIYRVLAKTGDNVVGEILRDQGTFYEWDHYPAGDIYDPETHSQFYYHAHPAEQRFEREHGHFHTFLRPKGMPPGTKPAPLPGLELPSGDNEALSHLVAVSMTGAGTAYRLFTVNRWVTGEVWYRAEDVIPMLDRFLVDVARPSWPTNRWISALFVLFRPQMAALVAARDETLDDWQKAHPDVDAYEDRSLEITSAVNISVEEQMGALRQALG